MSNEHAVQLTLFSDSSPVNAAAEGVAWSYSRRTTCEQCSLRYYNLYYGANRKTAKQDPAKERLHFLKQLSNRHLRTGEILHLGIRTYFKKARQGTPMSAIQLVDFARRVFQEDRRFSSTYPDGDGPNEGSYPKALLREYHYREPDADKLCEEAEERMAQALLAFATDACYLRFRQGGVLPDALIEQRFSLPDFACPVSGSVDLAYRRGSQVTVLDWKIGASDGTGDDSLQLAVYGLWALSKYQCAIGDIRICKVHLGSGEVIDFHLDEGVIDAARARIQQDIERLSVLHEYGKRGIAAAFTPCLQPAVCNLCVFERECYDRN